MVIFDLGAVLLNINYDKTIEEFEKLGIKNSSSFYSKKEQSNLFNLLDRRHYQIFGGTYLQRNASLRLSYDF